MIGFIIIGALMMMAIAILWAVGWYIGTYNTMVKAHQDVKGQIGNMKTEYQRRADFFYNLAQTVKSSAKFEKDTLTLITRARNPNYGTTVKQNMAEFKQLDNIFSKLMVVFEKYPQLKTTATFEKALDEIRITEDRINIARTEYNNIVNDYNQYIKMFPASVVAQKSGFVEAIYFENEKGTEIAPKMNYEA